MSYRKPKSNSVPFALRTASFVLLYISAVLLAAGALSYPVVLAADDCYAFVGSGERTEITLDASVATTERLADYLAEKNIIKYPSLFVFYAKREGYYAKYHPAEGVYEIDGGMSYREILNLVMEKNEAAE